MSKPTHIAVPFPDERNTVRSIAINPSGSSPQRTFDEELILQLYRMGERFADRLFALGAMEQAPCFYCGYGGHSYFQPSVHKCAKRHHDARGEF